MDIATASAIGTGATALYCLRPVFCTAVVCATARQPIAEFRCRDKGRLRLDVRVRFQPPSAARGAVTPDRELLENQSPGSPPRLTVLSDERRAAGSPHKP